VRIGREAAALGLRLKSGLVITAAHLTAADATMSVRIAGAMLPAKVLKQGSPEDVDLSLLSVDEGKATTLLNTLFRQRQFATLCRSNSDPNVTTCFRGSLVSPKHID
jgi:hypothetical protein